MGAAGLRVNGRSLKIKLFQDGAELEAMVRPEGGHGQRLHCQSDPYAQGRRYRVRALRPRGDRRKYPTCRFQPFLRIEGLSFSNSHDGSHCRISVTLVVSICVNL